MKGASATTAHKGKSEATHTARRINVPDYLGAAHAVWGRFLPAA